MIARALGLLRMSRYGEKMSCCRMPDWTETTPLRVVTGYHNIARRYFQEKGFEHVVLLSADGALEAAPLMGTADIILDLVESFAHMLASTSKSYVIMA